MNKNVLWGALAIIIAGGIWYFLQNGGTMNSSEEEEENMEEVMDEEMMDEMDEMSEEQDENMDDTDAGASAAEGTVSSGTKVVFKNGSSSLMWAASNPHPVHTDLSSFDAKSGASAGGTYSFTFEE